jgi:hypothetical protein
MSMLPILLPPRGIRRDESLAVLRPSVPERSREIEYGQELRPRSARFLAT